MQAEFGEFARIHNITEDDPTALLANGQTKWNKTKEYPASLFWEAFIEDYRDPVTHVGPPSERGREFANCFLVENTTTCFEALNRSFCVNNGQCYAAIDQC
jgi:hypothetical protein